MRIFGGLYHNESELSEEDRQLLAVLSSSAPEIAGPAASEDGSRVSLSLQPSSRRSGAPPPLIAEVSSSSSADVNDGQAASPQ
jgi:hypothetical protein